MERRFQLAADVEVRGSGRSLSGYAARFGSVGRIGDFSEVIRRGAFRRSLLSGTDLLALVDHDPKCVLARTGAGTLHLSEDDKGLSFRIDNVPNTTAGNDILELVRSGNCGGCSFAFTVPPGGDAWDKRARTLIDVNLLEVSLVSAWPAYPDTSVAARAAMTDNTRAALLRRLAIALS
jgi:HK97 family phage prohead protease